MKRMIYILCFWAFGIAEAQECTTSWPYLFPEFEKAIVYLKDGSHLTQKVNIHVRKSDLHFLDGDIIKKAEEGNVLRVEIENRIFLNVEGKMVEALKLVGPNFIGLVILGDFEALNETEGAYGSASSTSAAQRNSSIESGTSAGIYVNYTVLQKNKNEGIKLPLVRKYYLIMNGKLYLANRRGIESELTKEQKKAFKIFLKTNRIQWKNPESLVKVLDFLNQQ